MATIKLPGSLVSVDWLRRHLDAEELVIFDASWHMPATGRDGFDEWNREHIPGARFFDFDRTICDTETELPHMLPSAEIFTRELQALGLNQASVVIVYDTLGMFSSPRVWWMLQAMGCNRVALLDGGKAAWDKAGYPVEASMKMPETGPGNFVARPNRSLVVDAKLVRAALYNDTVCVLDARPESRFNGDTAEPRPGLRRGHMPGALNLPFTELFTQGLLKSKPELNEIISPLIADSECLICSCGSGVTACVIAFAAYYVGYENLAVYDGSWCEWGMPSELPVVSG